MGWLLLKRALILSVLCFETAAAADHFQILHRDGTLVSSAVLQELSRDRIRFEADKQVTDLARSAIVGFRAVPAARPRSSGSATLRLVNGDILTGELAALDDSGLEWVLGPADRKSDVRLTVPLEYVLGISFGLSLKDSLKTLVLREAQTGSDKILLSNGDELTGDLSELTLEQLTLETETGKTSIPLKSIRTIRFNEELTETPAQTPERTLIMLEPGTRLTLTDFQISRNSFASGEMFFGTALKLPLKNVQAAILLDSSTRPLSEREPAAVAYEPFLSSIPAVRKNLGVRGGPLQIGNWPYLTGWGMQSRTEITWNLAPTDGVLMSDIGVDVEAGLNGSVQFRILLDGKQVFESVEMIGGDPPQPLRIELHNAKTLTLVADFGKDGDVFDVAVWGNPLILDAPAAP